MEEQLTRLVQEVQRQAQGTEADPPALTELVTIILRSRKIGRPPQGQPLTGIYQELCDRLRQQLQTILPAAIATLQSSPMPLREWVHLLHVQAAQACLEDDLLKALALEAQAHPARSAWRRHALVQLVEAIRLSGRLARPHRTKFAPAFYDLLYEEAVNKTLTYVCRRIDTYDPQRGQTQKFMTWVNFRLDRTLIECRREFGDRQTQSLPTLQDLENLPQPPPPSTLAESVQEYIRTDRHQLFQATHIRNRPDASFQKIALARFRGQRWEDIAADLEIKVPTLSSFFQRCCDKFSAQFQELL